MNIKLLKTSCIALFFIFAATIPGSTQQTAALPRFEASECAIPVPSGEKATCGYLVVPENRARKNGKTIRLPVIILKSGSPHPKPDPILRTLGGPGASSLKMVTGRKFSPWLEQRDQIIFEQRGTRYAQPSLQCPEVDEAAINAAKQQQNEAAAKKAQLKAVRICRERLIKQGIDLAAYNSTESAADIEDLRRALKLEKINLYGLSYSARLMLNMMRDYPQGIRSVVLESTLPVEVNYDEAGVDGIARVLKDTYKDSTDFLILNLEGGGAADRDLRVIDYTGNIDFKWEPNFLNRVLQTLEVGKTPAISYQVMPASLEIGGTQVRRDPFFTDRDSFIRRYRFSQKVDLQLPPFAQLTLDHRLWVRGEVSENRFRSYFKATMSVFPRQLSDDFSAGVFSRMNVEPCRPSQPRQLQRLRSGSGSGKKTGGDQGSIVFILAQWNKSIVLIAPGPVLVYFEGSDYRVAFCVKVFGGVFVDRCVAAAHVPAG